jgi:hypothetical protein
MSTCVRGVLAQSDQDGWVRDTAREAHWKLQPLQDWFKPGYEVFNYEVRTAQKNQGTLTAFVWQDRTELGLYPAWEAKLKAMGYVWDMHKWEKILPRGDIPIPGPLDQTQTIYLMTYRSTPPRINQHFPFVGRVCADASAENIGLEVERVDLVDRERALTSTRYFCGKDWDSLPKGRRRVEKDWGLRASWLLPKNIPADYLKTEQPEVYAAFAKGVFPGVMEIDLNTHHKYCEWIQQQVGEKIL